MEVFCYHHETGEYLGQKTADHDPLDAENYLMPAFTTTIAPPTAGEYQTAVFTAGAWGLVPDYRSENVCEIDTNGNFVSKVSPNLGEELTSLQIVAPPPEKGLIRPQWKEGQWIDATMTVCEVDADGFYLGTIEIHGDDLTEGKHIATEPPPDNLLKPKWDGSAWVDGRTLDGAISSKLADLAAYRFELETGGIIVDDVSVATDRDSQALLTGAWCRCRQAAGTTVNWKGTNGWTQLDADAIDSLAAAVSEHVEACFTAEKTHSEAISALATVAAVDAYDFSTGWPDNNSKDTTADEGT